MILLNTTLPCLRVIFYLAVALAFYTYDDYLSFDVSLLSCKRKAQVWRFCRPDVKIITYEDFLYILRVAGTG